MQKNLSLPALILGIALVLSGVAIALGLSKALTPKRHVTVRGLSEREVKANHAIWPISYRLDGNDIKLLYEQQQEQEKTIRAFLVEGGINNKDILVGQSEIQSTSPEYNSGNRYTLIGHLSISTNDVDKVKTLSAQQNDLIKQGINISSNDQYSNKLVFEYTKLNDIKPAMIEEATKNARAAGKKFADDSESTLGKIKDATQGYFEISDRNEISPEYKRVRVVTTIDFYLE